MCAVTMNIHVTFMILISLGISISGQDFMQYILNENNMKQQVLCLLDNNSCDALGNQLRYLLPLLMQDECGRCSPQQKAYLEKMMNFIQRQYPEKWQTIKEKYNLPDNKRTARSLNDKYVYDVDEDEDECDDEIYIDEENDFVEISECEENNCS